ncbi:MAG: NosD domain-containing protein [Candidatus Hadarchaeales archaeon]
MRTVSASPDPHAPIYIEGDGNFKPANGVRSGSGTKTDPYIIENWEIDASNAHGIHIKNTTAYFVIRNVLVENGKTTYHGIFLENVVNGRIENVVSRKNSRGIFLSYSNNIRLSTNTVENNKYGIYLYCSSRNELWNNIVRYNENGNIYLLSSNNNTFFSPNTAGNGRYGIYLHSSDNNTFLGSTVENNRYGIYLYHSSRNELLNNIVRYNENGNIYLISSNNNTFSHNTVRNGGSIYLDFSDNNTFSTNTVENTFIGIHLHSSDNNTFSTNTVENNTYGIYLDNSGNNTLANNTVKNNRGHGIRLDSSDNNILTNNTVENSEEGIYFRSSDNNTLTNNTMKNNWSEGIYLYNSDNNTLTNNTVGNNGSKGIYLNSSDNNTFSTNTVENNARGIYLYYSYRNTLSNNKVENNSTGIYLDSSDNNTLTNNTVGNNGSEGIYLRSSDNNTLTNNRVENNFMGVYLVGSSNITMDNNVMRSNRCNFLVFGDKLSHFIHDIDNTNTVNGKPVLYLTGTENNLVINQDNRVGWLGVVNSNNIQVENLVVETVMLAFTHNTRVENVIVENSLVGIYLFSSSNNFLLNNTVGNNMEEGIHLHSSHNNILSNNIVRNNQLGIGVENGNLLVISHNVIENNLIRDIEFDGKNSVFEANVYTTARGIPHIHSVCVTDITQTSATITWATDKNSTSVVEYGPTAAYGYTATDGVTTNHRVDLSNLSPGTYHFRVLSTDSENNLEISGDFTFTTISLPTSITLEPSSFSLVSGGSREITAILRDNGGNPLSGKTISWSTTAGTITQTSMTDNLGRATATFTAPVVTQMENVTITATFAGDAGYGGSQENALCTVSPVPSTPTTLTVSPSSFTVRVGGRITLTAILLDNAGNPLPGKQIVWSTTSGSIEPMIGLTDNHGRMEVTFFAPSVSGSVEIGVIFQGDSVHARSQAIGVGTVSQPRPGTRPWIPVAVIVIIVLPTVFFFLRRKR